MNTDRIPKQGEIYRHFKNKLYQIIAIATHSETHESYVVYQALYGDFRTYIRPLDMFISEVDHIKYPAATQRYRFERVDRTTLNNSSYDNNHIFTTNTPDDSYNNNDDDFEEHDGLINPLLVQFLELDTYKEKLEFFQSIIPKLDDRLTNDICVALDIACSDTSLDDRIAHIRDYLNTQTRFEITRF